MREKINVELKAIERLVPPFIFIDVKRHFLKLALRFGCVLLAATGCHFVSSDNLNQAIASGETESVRNAIARGADVNGRGMHAMTPLMTASKAGRLDICKLLVARGADVSGHNESGSVLMWAVESRNEELVRFLLKSGADRAWTNALGRTAESLARQSGLTNLAALVRTQ
jgi:ankyrin repeat protein